MIVDSSATSGRRAACAAAISGASTRFTLCYLRSRGRQEGVSSVQPARAPRRLHSDRRVC